MRLTALTFLVCVGCGGASTQSAQCTDTTTTTGTPSDGATTGSASSGDTRAEVVLDGTPEIPPALHARLQQYLETRTATVQDIDDDGDAMLVTTRFANTAQAHRIASPLGDRHQITFGDEPVLGASFIPGVDDAVLIQSDVGGDENYQLYRFDLTSGRQTLITDGEHRQTEFLWTRDGAHLAYVSNARNGRDMDIWMSDGHGPGELFLEREGDWHLLDFTRDGSRLLIQEYVSINEQNLYVVDVSTREVGRISPEGPPQADRAAIFDATGDHVYFASDRGGQFVQLYDYRISDLALTMPRPDTIRPLSGDVPWNVEELALSPDGHTLAYTLDEDGISMLRTVDLRSLRTTDVVGLPSGVITGLRFARRAPVVAFTVTSSALSGDAFTYDVRQREVQRWTESEMGGLDPSRFVEPTLVHYPTFDGRSIPCFYYRPQGEGPFPVVVHIHGGPEAQARPWFIPLIQYLALEEHVAVLMPNVRGSDGYGRDYLALDDGALREDTVRDIGSLLDWAGQQHELDASRIAVYGGSYGGYMVLASLTHFSDRLRAGIEIVGIANFVTFLENTAAYRRDLRRVEYGDESDAAMRATLAEISPITHVDQIGTALFVAHGANDPRVPVEEAEQIVHAVREHGHEVWYMLARNEGHGFVRKENRDTFAELSVLFLERQLGLSTAQ
jgi:dipeptidyl aminopeptidase/acylaminoacyl peptidase